MGARQYMAPVTSLVFSAVFFFILAYSAILMKRFSPVYTPVECVNTNKSFEFILNKSGAFVTAFTTMECNNPNPFSVEIEKGSPGRVFFHPENIEIGSVVIEEYALAQGGTAEMKADVALHILPSEIPLLLPGENQSAGEGAKHILQEMHVHAVAYLNVLGFNIAYHFNQLNTCGFGMETYPATMSYKTGPAICATSQEELIRNIPGINATATPFVIGVDDKMLNKAKMMRDAGCGSAMAISALLGFLFLRVALRRLSRERKLMMTSEHSNEEREEKFPEPEKSPVNAV